ncbi:hypothetical protein F5Y10DRAFT_285715 [Nemania abortiva]|nr:hypothetical protein F5Y10DRAFT_285715 [Nemania abortiva]
MEILSPETRLRHSATGTEPLSNQLEKPPTASEISLEKAEKNTKMDLLQEALEETQRRLKEEERKVVTLQNQIAEKDQQVSNYKRMIVRSGRREDGPNDAQIIELFVKLKSDIVSFCIECLPAGIQVRCRFEGASPEIGDLFMRAEVANQLYLGFFQPSTVLFGHKDAMNNAAFRERQDDGGSNGPAEFMLSPYQSIERTFILAERSGIMTEDEVKDWRIMTVSLARKAPKHARYHIAQADDMWRTVLQQYSAHFVSGRKRSHLNQTPQELIELCKTAYNIALIFRSSRIEYRWMQMPDVEVSPHDAEVLGTTGALQSEPHRVERIIFGGVIRGNRNSGKIKDGSTPLLKAGVVIGFL